MGARSGLRRYPLGLARPRGGRSASQSASTTPAARREGIFEGLDADGRLLFRGEGGIETIETADLWILPASDDSPAAGASVSRAREGRS